MIRTLVRRTYSAGLDYVELAGLSTENKPMAGIVTGSRFTEADTGDVYMFAEGDTPAWSKIIAGPAASDTEPESDP